MFIYAKVEGNYCVSIIRAAQPQTEPGLITLSEDPGPPPTSKHRLRSDTLLWEDTTTLSDHKDAQWELIRSERDAREASGFFYAGKMLDSDPRSVQRINTAVQAAQAAVAANQPFTLLWTCQDNSTLWFDAAGMMGMPAALAVYANTLHETARDLRAQIDAATTISEIEAITWPA